MQVIAGKCYRFPLTPFHICCITLGAVVSSFLSPLPRPAAPPTIPLAPPLLLVASVPSPPLKSISPLPSHRGLCPRSDPFPYGFAGQRPQPTVTAVDLRRFRAKARQFLREHENDRMIQRSTNSVSPPKYADQIAVI